MVVEEENLLLVAGSGDLDNLAVAGQGLHDLLGLGQGLVDVIVVHPALAVQVPPLQHLHEALFVPQFEGGLEFVTTVIGHLKKEIKK